MLMEDNRLLKTGLDVKECIAEDVIWLSLLPLFVWNTLSALLQGSLTAFKLRGKVIKCAYTAFAQFYFRTLIQLD